MVVYTTNTYWVMDKTLWQTLAYTPPGPMYWHRDVVLAVSSRRRVSGRTVDRRSAHEQFGERVFA